MVTLTLRVLSRPDVDHLPKIYQSLGMDYDERVLPSIGNEVLKSIVAQFDAAELITQREVVSVMKLLKGIQVNMCAGVFKNQIRFAAASWRI
jgi:regulator of protease activity HflC (stomatin/prohibitin superfamily)